MQVPGPLLERIQAAIIEAVGYSNLRRLLRACLDSDLDALVTQKETYPNQLLELLLGAQRLGELLPLLRCLAAEQSASQAELSRLYGTVQAGLLAAPGTASPVDPAVAVALLADLPTDAVPPVAALPPGSSVPFEHNPLFRGRDRELLWLARTFKGWPGAGIPTAAIAGIGGVGKSQLAAEFARRCGRYFAGGAYWMGFADAKAVEAEIASACKQMPGLPPHFHSLDVPAQLQAILQAWRSDLPRLLVFDNCEDEALLEAWRPLAGGARILLTSRRERFDPVLGLHVLPLATLARPDSIALLQRFLAGSTSPKAAWSRRTPAPGPSTALDAVAAELGDLPLALHVAGSFLGAYAGSVTPEQYLQRLRDDPLDPALKKAVGRSPTRHDLFVAGTFAVSYAQLDPSGDPGADRLALDLLARAACFAPGEPIPRDLLTKTLDLEGTDDPLLAAADAWRRLADLGLLSSSESGDPFLHRLIAIFVLSLQGDDTAQAAVEQTVIAEASRINETGDPRPLLAWRVHLAHIVERALDRGDERAATLANNLGYHLNMAGDLAGARPLLERSLAIKEQALGEQHPDTALSLNNLGLLLQDMGDLPGARPLLERSLAINEQVLGDQHPDTATGLNNLGSLLQDMGDLAGARPYFERSLAIREQVLGEQHPNTATGLNNLGSLLQDMGDLAGAGPLLERSLAINEQVLGEQHPNTATGLNNLGMLLQAMGDLAGARPLLERSLAIIEQVLGEQHPATAGSLNNLGSLLQDMGDLAGARPYFERSLAINEQVLGEQHPDTAASLNNLGSLLMAVGDLAAARPLLERSLAITEQVLGDQHPDTATSLSWMGAILIEEGKPGAARPYLERALAAFMATLGPNHPNTKAVQRLLDGLDSQQ